MARDYCSPIRAFLIAAIGLTTGNAVRAQTDSYCPIMLMSQANGIYYYYSMHCVGTVFTGYNWVSAGSMHSTGVDCSHCNSPIGRPVTRPVIPVPHGKILAPESGTKLPDYISPTATFTPGSTTHPVRPKRYFSVKVMDGGRARYFRVAEFSLSDLDSHLPNGKSVDDGQRVLRVGQELKNDPGHSIDATVVCTHHDGGGAGYEHLHHVLKTVGEELTIYVISKTPMNATGTDCTSLIGTFRSADQTMAGAPQNLGTEAPCCERNETLGREVRFPRLRRRPCTWR